jgi:hypothetical protein
VTLNGMVWRIHFTAADLDRIQVGPTLGCGFHFKHRQRPDRTAKPFSRGLNPQAGCD